MKSSNKKINKEKNESKNIQKKKEESESDEEEQNLNEDKKSESKVNKIVALDSNEDINGIFCKDSSFKSIGVCDELCEVLEKLNYKYPTKIQKESLPYALDGKDIIGLAETGSGKTFAYGIPIIQKLLDTPNYFFFACILAPTRELCLQINQHLEILGSGIGLKIYILVGGLDFTSQVTRFGF